MAVVLDRTNPARPPATLSGGLVDASRRALLAAAIAVTAWAAPARADSASDGCGVSTEAGAEQVFQSDLSAMSVAAFSRDMQTVGSVDPSQFGTVRESAEETIRALRGGVGDHQSDSDGTLQAFWKDDPSAAAEDVADFSSSVDAANAAGVGNASGNVLIPLPPAVVSGLSVMGGLGAMTWIRRIFKR